MVQGTANFTVTGFSGYAVNMDDGSKLNLEVSFDLGSAGKLPAYAESFDLCEKLSCPVGAGDDFTLKYD